MYDQDRKLFTRVSEIYHETNSIRDTATKMALSRSKVRKILITMGEMTSEITEQAVSLLQQGKSQQEIAEILRVSEATLSTYIPYGNRVFGREERTDYAVRSEKYRARQVKAARGQVHRMASGNNSTLAHINSVDNNDIGEEQKMSMESCAESRILRLQLVLETTEDALTVLRKYGKADKGIIREICVPAYYPLHSLHFAIQKMFGWQNSHLHHYELPEEVFYKLTKDKFMEYCRLCGLYFRFPYSDNDHALSEIYWDDDYEEGQSFKSWLKRKYSGPHHYGALKEHYLFSQIDARNFCSAHETLRIGPTFAEYVNGKRDPREVRSIDVTCTEMGGFFGCIVGELIERVGVGNILFSCNKEEDGQNKAVDEGYLRSIVDQVDEGFASAYNELISPETHQKTQVVVARKQKGSKRQNEKIQEALATTPYATWLTREDIKGKEALLQKTDVAMPPVCSEMRYEYDYGDGWSVSIRCMEEYRCDLDGETIGFFCEDGTPLTKEFSDMLYHKCLVDGNPICIAVDGLPVFDDVGGVGGYCDFLKCVRGKTAEERDNCYIYDDPEETKEWARSLGWTGRMSKPENML